MAEHIKELQINTYRGIHELMINDLGSVNIFVGDNNTGKTSVLEAVQFLCAPNKYNLLQIARQREKYRLRMGLSLLDSVRYMFNIYSETDGIVRISLGGKVNGVSGNVNVTGSMEKQLIDLNELAIKQYIPMRKAEGGFEEVDTFIGRIESDFDDYGQLKLDVLKKRPEEFEINNYSRYKISLGREEKLLKAKFILTEDHVLENAIGDLIKNSQIKNKAVELIRSEFDEKITDLRIISDESHRYIPVVETENGDYIPLSLYGDGMQKALTMLNAIVSTSGGVVLIDEFETALHTSAMDKVFSFITETARKYEVQLFMTTHSIEAVDKMLESAGNSIASFKIIRLKKKNGKTYSNVMNGCEAERNRKEYNLELRV